MNEKEILDELSISVACLLDDAEEINGQDIIKAEVKDIEHIQDLVTRLEYEKWKREKDDLPRPRNQTEIIKMKLPPY